MSGAGAAGGDAGRAAGSAPRHALDTLDHAAWIVRDLDAAAAVFARLGFRLSPRQHHSAEMGSANHTFVLGDAYVELIGMTAPTAFNAPWRARLEEREGLYMASLRTGDAAAAWAALAARGVDATAPVPHARPATLPDGRTVTVAFDTVYVAAAATAPLHVSACHHHQPEHVFVPSLAVHPNGACRLDELIVASDAPAAATERFAAVAGVAPCHADGQSAVPLGGAAVLFVAPERLRRHWRLAAAVPLAPVPAGIVVGVADPAACRSWFAEHGVVATAIDGGLLVDATGARIEFRLG